MSLKYCYKIGLSSDQGNFSIRVVAYSAEKAIACAKKHASKEYQIPLKPAEWDVFELERIGWVVNS